MSQVGAGDFEPSAGQTLQIRSGPPGKHGEREAPPDARW